jgi:hypothetical protein
MLGFMGQMARFPVVVSVYAARMMVTTFEGMSRMTGEALGEVAGRVEPPARPRAGVAVPVRTGAPRRGAVNPKEMPNMSDTNLNDRMVKLVEYTIVSIQREKEEILEGPKQVLETDDLAGDAFSNSRIAAWVAEHPDVAKRLDLDDLRVHYQVLARWPKRDLKYDERTLEFDEKKTKLLGEIVQKLEDLGKSA